MALRNATRKVWALERPRPFWAAVSRAAAEEPRRLLPRLIHGEMPPSSYRRFCSSAASEPPSNFKHGLSSCKKNVPSIGSQTNNPVSIDKQIEDKKEELLRLLLKKALHKVCAQKNEELRDLLSKTNAHNGGTGLGFALGRFGGGRGGGAGAAAPGLVVPAAGAARGRSVSATSAANAPVPGDQGVGMEQPKQQQPQVPPQDAGDKNKRDDVHKTMGDVMIHSFGEGYSTRSDEEGFGGVYGGNDPVEHPGTKIHPSHPEYDTSQGSKVKEKARHLKDDKHAT